ncbi:MAG: hypothetical protein WAU75_03440, partial [Solirubrobacteraceae bacterium]
MSLKLRLALAAGVAVAIAVIAVAISAYAGTRAQLNGQVDQSLRSLTMGIVHHPGNDAPPPGASSGPPGRGGTGLDRDDLDEGLGLADHRGPAFGGPAGTVMLIRRDGTVYVPPGQTYRIPLTARFKATAARGTGHSFTEMSVGGTEIRV